MLMGVWGGNEDERGKQIMIVCVCVCVYCRNNVLRSEKRILNRIASRY